MMAPWRRLFPYTYPIEITMTSGRNSLQDISGRISKTEMLHERERWYNRLVAENRLEDYLLKDEWKKWKNIHRSFGYVFVGLGLILLALIVDAMTSGLNTHEPKTTPAVTQPGVPGGKP
jgi:hypothetical protein